MHASQIVLAPVAVIHQMHGHPMLTRAELAKAEQLFERLREITQLALPEFVKTARNLPPCSVAAGTSLGKSRSPRPSTRQRRASCWAAG
jgi:hypothetical protein